MSKELSISQNVIENQIFTVRKVQVMIDYHLAELYDVETKRINEQVKRNAKRFPENFMFQLRETLKIISPKLCINSIVYFWNVRVMYDSFFVYVCFIYFDTLLIFLQV